MISKTYDQCVVDKLSPVASATSAFNNQIIIEGQGTKSIYCIQAGYFSPSAAAAVGIDIVGLVIVAEGQLMADVLITPFTANRNNFAFLRDAGLTRVIKFLPITKQGTQVFRFSDRRPLRATQNGPLSVIQTVGYLFDPTGPTFNASTMLASLQIDGETTQQGIEGQNKSPFRDLV